MSLFYKFVSERLCIKTITPFSTWIMNSAALSNMSWNVTQSRIWKHTQTNERSSNHSVQSRSIADQWLRLMRTSSLFSPPVLPLLRSLPTQEARWASEGALPTRYVFWAHVIYDTSTKQLSLSLSDWLIWQMIGTRIADCTTHLLLSIRTHTGSEGGLY